MHVCGVTSQQDPSLAVSRGLPCHIGEPRDPSGTVDPEVRPVYIDQRLADIAQGRFAPGSHLPFGQHHTDPVSTLQSPDRMGANGVVAKAPSRLLGCLDLSNQPALRWIPSGVLDPGCLTNHAAPSIAADKIFSPHRAAVG